MRRLCPLARLLAAHTGYLANYTASFWCTGSGSGSWQSVKEYSPQAASKAAPTIKSQLRELYKRVHPDLFHHSPPAREANEASFKLLQEYLAVAERGSERPGPPYRFVFYLRPTKGPEGKQKPAQEAMPDGQSQRQSQGLADGPAEAADESFYPPGELDFAQAASAAEAATVQAAAERISEDLERVSLTLPPPGRKDPHTAPGGQLPRTTQLALGKLLAACGLDAALAGEVAGASQPLRDFLPEAAELLKQRENQQKGPRHQLAVMRSALRLGRQVTVGFVDSLRQQGADVQVALMEKLVAALDRLQHIDLDGINIIIGHGYGVDSTGAVRLTAKGSSSDWTGQLMQVDPGECRRKQVSMQNLHHLESAVAQAVGVSMIYTSTELAAQPAYTPFLQRLAYHATTEGAVRPLEAREVPLRIETGRGSSQVPSMSGQAGFGVDDVLGFITVPITATPTQVYQHIKWQAPKAQSILQHNRADAERSEGLRHSVERALRLRRLLRGPGVPTDGFRECCRRMLQNRDALGSLLEGTSVRIAHDNSVAPDGAHIDIAWNFVL